MEKTIGEGIIKPKRSAKPKAALTAHNKLTLTFVDFGNGFSKWIEGEVDSRDEALLTDDVRWSRIQVNGQRIRFNVIRNPNGSHKLTLDIDPV